MSSFASNLLVKIFLLSNPSSNPFFFFLFFTAKALPKLKSRYKGHLKVTSDYARTIEDFDKLFDPRTLSRHFLGLEPSLFILRAIKKEEKSKLCNENFYARVSLS